MKQWVSEEVIDIVLWKSRFGYFSDRSQILHQLISFSIWLFNGWNRSFIQTENKNQRIIEWNLSSPSSFKLILENPEEWQERNYLYLKGLCILYTESWSLFSKKKEGFCLSVDLSSYLNECQVKEDRETQESYTKLLGDIDLKERSGIWRSL